MSSARSVQRRRSRSSMRGVPLSIFDEVGAVEVFENRSLNQIASEICRKASRKVRIYLPLVVSNDSLGTGAATR